MNNKTKCDRELWQKWVEPYYLFLINFRWLRQSANADKPRFVKIVQPAIANLTETIVEDLLSCRNWRHQLVGSWFAGVKKWSHYTNKIGCLLGGYYRQMGVCFALASFGNELSTNYLSRYLEEYILNENPKDKFWDNHHLFLAVHALVYLDSKLGYKYYQKFYLQNETFLNHSETSNITIEESKQIFQKMIIFRDKWF